MNLQTTYNDLLERSTENYKVLELLGKQLEKDLVLEDGMFHIDDVRIWPNILYNVIEDMMSRNLERFFATMYRIDLSEKVLKGTMIDGEYDLHELAEAVLSRELQKVLIRLAYS